MIGKVISGGLFGGTVGYVMKELSRVLGTRGVEPPGVREMVEKYEQWVRRRVALDEQARLKAQDAEQLKRDAAKLKNK